MNRLAGRSRPTLIEGYAIVSADGMIAEANGSMDALRFDADQQFFWASLDTAAAVAHGRHSAEGGPKAAGRHRLILARRLLPFDLTGTKRIVGRVAASRFLRNPPRRS